MTHAASSPVNKSTTESAVPNDSPFRKNMPPENPVSIAMRNPFPVISFYCIVPNCAEKVVADL
jgi:hypothetical protein